jgi:hypothetical protein
MYGHVPGFLRQAPDAVGEREFDAQIGMAAAEFAGERRDICAPEAQRRYDPQCPDNGAPARAQIFLQRKKTGKQRFGPLAKKPTFVGQIHAATRPFEQSDAETALDLLQTQRNSSTADAQAPCGVGEGFSGDQRLKKSEIVAVERHRVPVRKND